MKTLKRISFWVVSYLIRVVLFATITAGVAVAIVGKSSYVKDVLRQTNSYARFVPAVIEANKAAPSTSNTLNYEDKNIVMIFTDSFPAEDLKVKTEMVIDSVYAWLEGKTPALTFSADFSNNKLTLADKLSSYAFARLASLPVCKNLPETVNPLTIDCQPTGFNLKDVQESYRQQLLASDSFLSKTVLTETDLPKNDTGKTLADQYNFAPAVFQWTMRAPYILGFLMVVLSVLYVWLSPRRRKGIAGLGFILLSAGVSLALFPILFDIIIPHFTGSFQAQSGTQGTQAIFSDVISSITHHFYTLFITIGIQLFVAGLCIYLLERATRDDAAKYKNIENKAGIATSNQKKPASPKSLRGKLSYENIPVQTSDLPTRLSPKKVAENKKYAKLYKKKKM